MKKKLENTLLQNNLIVEIPVIKNDIGHIKKSIEEISKKQNEILIKIEEKYVTKIEFNLLENDVRQLQKLINKVTWTVIATVISAVLSLVISMK